MFNASALSFVEALQANPEFLGALQKLWVDQKARFARPSFGHFNAELLGHGFLVGGMRDPDVACLGVLAHPFEQFRERVLAPIVTVTQRNIGLARSDTRDEAFPLC